MKLSFIKIKKEEAPKRFLWNPIHPRRDWERLLVLFTFLILMVAAWSAYVFFFGGRMKKEGVAIPQNSQDVTTEEIDRINQFFKGRQNPSVDPAVLH